MGDARSCCHLASKETLTHPPNVARLPDQFEKDRKHTKLNQNYHHRQSPQIKPLRATGLLRLIEEQLKVFCIIIITSSNHCHRHRHHHSDRDADDRLHPYYEWSGANCRLGGSCPQVGSTITVFIIITISAGNL